MEVHIGPRAKMTKAELIQEIGGLQRRIEEFEEGSGKLSWYAVAPYGWGSWESSVYFTEACTPTGALEDAEKALKYGIWSPDCWDDYPEETTNDPLAGRVFVYKISEVGIFNRVVREIAWEKQ